MYQMKKKLKISHGLFIILFYKIKELAQKTNELYVFYYFAIYSVLVGVSIFNNFSRTARFFLRIARFQGNVWENQTEENRHLQS